jgi:hypothetical protein
MSVKINVKLSIRIDATLELTIRKNKIDACKLLLPHYVLNIIMNSTSFCTVRL